MLNNSTSGFSLDRGHESGQFSPVKTVLNLRVRKTIIHLPIPLRAGVSVEILKENQDV